MAKTDLFEEMLATYPAEKRELAREVYHRFADGDSTQFFTQLLLVLDVYARYVERIPKAAVQANQDSFAILEDMREEITMMAKTIEARDVNITNHAAKTDELCKITQAKCDETVASIELMLKNLGSQVDTKAIVKGIEDAMKNIFLPLHVRASDLAYLRTVRSGDRATEFKQRCTGLGIKGVSLHSYRYAWAERAKTAGYPERFAQVNLGHNSRAMARAYSRKAPVEMPSLSEYERQQKAIIGNRNTEPAAPAVAA